MGHLGAEVPRAGPKTRGDGNDARRGRSHGSAITGGMKQDAEVPGSLKTRHMMMMPGEESESLAGCRTNLSISTRHIISVEKQT